MLAIRMQRTGRKGHANFRVVVQDSRQTPTSGKVVAQIGTYDPHTKAATLAKDKAEFYLTHGAQPSDRVARLLKQEGVKLPKWVSLESKKKGELRNPEKLRKNRPAEVAPVAASEEAPVETSKAAQEPEAPVEGEANAPVEEPAVAPEAETPTEESSTEATPEAEASTEQAAEEPKEASSEEAEKPAE